MCRAGSGKDVWGVDSLTNYPPGARPAAAGGSAACILAALKCGSCSPKRLVPPVHLPAGEGRKELPVQANDEGVQTPIDLPCQCSDADPRGEESQEVEVSCFWQRHFGKCGESYM